MIKASGGIGLKEPSLEQSFGGNFRVQGNPDLEPERSRTLDAGVAQSLWDDRLWFEATLYHHEYEDQIILGNLDVPTLETTLPEFTPEELRQIRNEIKTGLREPIRLEIDFNQFRPSYVNLGKTRAQGVELAFGASPVSGTQIRADYTFLDGVVLESSERGGLEEGFTLPNRPRHQFAFDAQSQIKGVTLGATLNYVGERLADVDFVSRALGITELEAFTRLDLRGAIQFGGRYEVYVVGENVLNAEYQEILGYPALGRAVRAGLRLDFSM
jgi:vitamin B12 transporter